MLYRILGRTITSRYRLPWFDDMDVEFGTGNAHLAIDVVLLAVHRIDPAIAVALSRRADGESVPASAQMHRTGDPDPDIAIAAVLVTLYRDIMVIAGGYDADAPAWERRIDRPLLLTATDLLVSEAARLRRSATREPPSGSNDPAVAALLRELDEAWRQILVLRDDIRTGILVVDPNWTRDVEFHRKRITQVLDTLHPVCLAARRRERLLDQVGRNAHSTSGWLKRSLLIAALRREVRRTRETGATVYPEDSW